MDSLKNGNGGSRSDAVTKPRRCSSIQMAEVAPSDMRANDAQRPFVRNVPSGLTANYIRCGFRDVRSLGGMSEDKSTLLHPVYRRIAFLQVPVLPVGSLWRSPST